MNFSKTKPDLVVPSMENIVQDVTGAKINHNTFSENICSSLQHIYDDYLKKYFFFIFLIIVAVTFLLYRYYQTKYNKEKIKKNIDKQDQIANEIRQLLIENKK